MSLQQFTKCNPIVVDAKHDEHGRYEVWCRKCGPSASTYHQTAADAHDQATAHREGFTR